jgi:prevent-host-death family protein
MVRLVRWRCPAKRHAWPVQDAKAQFSALIAEAVGGEPQVITKHGRDVAVVISATEYEKLQGKPRGSLVEFLSRSGFSELDIPERDPADRGRTIDL